MGARRPIAERLMARVQYTAYGCWEWNGYLTADGYATISRGGKCGQMLKAHRVSYQLHRGEIPEGLQTDHLCRNRKCVNPWHLELVTGAENSRRGISGMVNGARERAKTHCPRGHAYDEINTYRNRKGDRICRRCNREKSLAAYHARKHNGAT